MRQFQDAPHASHLSAIPKESSFLGLASVDVVGSTMKAPFSLWARHDGEEVFCSTVVHREEDEPFVCESFLWVIQAGSTGCRVQAHYEDEMCGALMLFCDGSSRDGSSIKKWCPLFKGGLTVGELLIIVTFRMSQDSRHVLARKLSHDSRPLSARRAGILERSLISKEDISGMMLHVDQAVEQLHDAGYTQPFFRDFRYHSSKLGEDKPQESSNRAALLNPENARFQQLIDEIASTGPLQGENVRLLRLYEEVQKISQDFAEAASHYGHIIISELHLPVAQKTIKPSNEMGGVLGGQKFLVNNIFFKCPEERVFNEYPDPMWASMKVAGHELKGLKCLSSYFLDQGSLGVHMPMAAIIDSRGHRLLAISLLPISGATLVYGTDNAASSCIVKQDDAVLLLSVNEACKHLGLKMHSVVNGVDLVTRQQGNDVDIMSPIDLEGHKGLDGRYYLIDCSRLMPPLYKNDTLSYDKHWPFYYSMRPEFLVQYGRPLNPDAFSAFPSRLTKGKVDGVLADQEEIKVATQNFFDVHLPLVARRVLEYWINSGKEMASFSLTKKLHFNGVNMRFLGALISLMRCTFTPVEMAQSFELLKWYECEALARAGKNCLRARLRAAHKSQLGSGSAHLIDETMLFLNDFVGVVGTPDWMMKNNDVTLCLRSNFGFSESDLALAIATFLTGDTASSNHCRFSARAFVLERLCEMTGLEIEPQVMEGLRAGRMGFKETIISLAAPDIEFKSRVKHLNIADHATGFILYQQGLNALDAATKISYFNRAHRKLVAALNSSPFDARGLTLAGDINLRQMVLESDPVVVKLLGQLAKDYFVASILADPLNIASRRSYAELKAINLDFRGAEELYLQALELCDTDQMTLLKYADFLQNSLKDINEAKKIYDRYQICVEMNDKPLFL